MRPSNPSEGHAHSYIDRRFLLRMQRFDGTSVVDIPEQEGVCVSFDVTSGYGTFRLADNSHVVAHVVRTVLLPGVS